MNLKWQEQNNGREHVLFEIDTGRVIGRVTQLKETFYANGNSSVLGEYISLEFAKQAILSSKPSRQEDSNISVRP